MNRFRSVWCALLGTAFLLALPRTSQSQTDEAKARRWRVMVIVQERHIDRPHIPDPAVETMLSKQLIDAGYKVIDQDRIRELRYSTVVDRIVAGGPNTAKNVIELGRKFGADLLITGEAFTQEETRENVTTDLGTVVRIRCRGRIEIKCIRMDTAEKIYADSIHKTGAPEATVELASKICLEQGAEDIAPAMLKKLDKLSLGSDQHIELDVRGIASISLSNTLEKLLSKLPGILDIGQGDYAAHTYSVEVHLNKIALRDFASKLESHPSLKRFHLHVESANGSKVIAVAK